VKAYTHIKSLAAAIAASTTIRNHCVAIFGQGALVRIDDLAGSPLTNLDAPFICVAKIPQQELGEVTEYDEFKLNISVGISMSEDAQVPAVTTARSESANGLEQVGDAELAEDLLELVLNVARSHIFTGNVSLWNVVSDSDGWTTFPLQTAEAELTLRRHRTMGD